MMNRLVRTVSYILVACIASAATFAFVGARSKPMTIRDPGLSKLEELQGMIDSCYIGEADEKTLTDAAANAMVNAVGDRWSYYIPAESMQSHNDNLNNSYVGIGITVQFREDDKGFDVKELTPGGPALEAGILPGDIVYKVEGESVSILGKDEATNRIRGEAGTRVNITVLRQEQELAFSVERRAIQVVVASGKLLPEGIGLVSIENFNKDCAQTTIDVIQSLRSQGATAMIFDVRFNPGGYRHELVELLDYLLPEGLLFRSEYYTGETDEDWSDKSFLDMPMAVLVNGDSYSAAEFFAAALREYEAAVVVGTQTCGKGYYQQTLKLSDGSAVNLSTGKYYTPKGVSLAEVGGLVPDVVVEVDDETYVKLYSGLVSAEEDAQLQAAVQALLGNKKP